MSPRRPPRFIRVKAKTGSKCTVASCIFGEFEQGPKGIGFAVNDRITCSSYDVLIKRGS